MSPTPYLQNYPVHMHRRGLARTLEAVARGHLRVGFLGGSITAPTRSNWPEGVISYLSRRFPQVRLYATNAGIGATGSMSACVRVEREILQRECDLVFVEYAVNDREEERGLRRRTREGLIRKLLAGEGRDVILTYTYGQSFYEDMAAGRVPESILDFEELAEHYSLGSAWMALHAWNEVRAGHMRWEEWLPDGLHPQSRGSWSYATCVNEFLADELATSTPSALRPAEPLPPPLDPGNWEGAWTLPFEEIITEGPWVVRTSNQWFADQLLETVAIGATLRFNFSGRGVCLGFDFGHTSSEFRYRFDGREWQTSERQRQSWCPESGWFRHYLLTETLSPGPHTLEIEVIHGDRADCKGTNFRLAQVAIL